MSAVAVQKDSRPRKLREEEIRGILARLPEHRYLLEDIGSHLLQRTRESLRSQLEQISIYPECIPALASEIEKAYQRCQIQPGESVGIISAQSNGERQTQLVLNSFHVAGKAISTVVTGVPRFAELLNATKNPKHTVTNVRFRSRPSTIEALREVIGSSLVELRLSNLVTAELEEGGIWESYWNQSLPSQGVSRFRIDQGKLYTFRLTLADLQRRLKELWPSWNFIRSPERLGIITAWSSIPGESGSELLHSSIPLFGVPGITSLIFKREEGSVGSGGSGGASEWVVEAIGCNLEVILGISNVDSRRTLSNHMWEIFEILGTEAVREFLFREFITVVSADAYINTRHVSLLVDMMMYTGQISSISRYGVHRGESGPLTKCSFEESMDQFVFSGFYGDLDTTAGISSSIICGKPSRAGTGLVELQYTP